MYSIKALKALRAEARRYDMSALNGYYKASFKRLQKVCNGIGAEWMPAWLRGFVSWLLKRVEAVATIHDWDYQYLDTTVWNFCVANWRFLTNSFRAYAPVTGIASFIVLMLFGWRAFRDGKKEVAK